MEEEVPKNRHPYAKTLDGPPVQTMFKQSPGSSRNKEYDQMIDERNEEDPASPGAEQQHGGPPKQKNFFTAFKRIQHIFSNNTPA